MRLLRGLVLVLLGFPTPAFASYCVPGMTPAQPQGPDPTPPICGPGSNSAAQSANGCADCDICSKSPGYFISGTYVNNFGDLEIRTAGMYPLVVTRRYDSGRPTDGPIGAGWSLSLTAHLYYAAYLVSAPNTYTYEADIIMPSGLLYRFNASGNSFTAPAGSFDTLVRNGDGTYTFSIEHTRSAYHFNADGSLASLTDDYGNAITYSYDASGRLHEVADAAGSGRFVDVTWGADGRVSSLTDSAGRIWKYFFESGDGTLTSFSDPLVSADSSQRTTYYTYTQGRFGPVLSQIQDRWHRTISVLSWYSDGRLKSYTEGDYNDVNPSASSGEKYSYVYGGGFATKTDSFGSKTYFWNGQGVTNDPAHVLDPATGQVLQDLTQNVTYTYNSRGNVATLGVGNISGGAGWTYTYDANFPDQVTKITPTQPTQWSGWKFRYNSPAETPPGALAEIDRINNDGVTTTTLGLYIYDAHGHLTTATDANGIIRFYTYNAAGDLVSARIAGNTATYDHDSLGRVTKVTTPTGHVSTYAYDAANRLTAFTLPSLSANPGLDFTSHVSYDLFDSTTGLVSVTTTDPNGKTTSEGYDAFGNLIQAVDALGNTTQYSYQYNLLHTLTDPNGNALSYQYDINRRLSTITYPDGTSETYSYTTPDGRTWRVVDRRGQTKTFAYDPFGRVSSVSFGSPSGTQTVTYSYSGQNLTGVTDSRATPTLNISYTYDSQWRLATETQVGGDKISYSYGAGDVLAGYRLDPPSGQTGTTITASMTYDAGGRLSTLQWSPVSGTFAYTYTPDGQYSAVQFPDGQGRTFAYDEQGRLTSVANTDTHARSFLTYAYGYDYDWNAQSYSSLGNRTSVTVTGSSAFIQNGTTKYMFDANRQLVGVTRADGSIWAYDYDALGNRVRVGGANGLTYYQYTYYQNASGKNTQRLRNAMGPEFAYDANGNVVTEGGTSYTWDVSNRLVGTAGAKYVYDYMDRLAQYIPPASGPAVRNITLGQDTIAERSTDPTRTNDYLFGPGIDEPLAKRASDGTISYYAIDGLGSVVATTDGSAQISRSAGFDEWGSPISGAADFFGYGGALVGRPPYIGWNRRHRYYRPGLGRFMNEDPLEQHLRIASLQTYVYAANNPISFGDPYGLFCFSYTSYGPKQTYAKSPPKWTGWQPAGEHESPHEPEPGVPYKASNGSMAQAGGYKFGAPDNDAGGAYGFWPFYDIECVWVNEFTSTEYWKRKITIYHMCTCPLTLWTSDGGYSQGQELQIITKHTTLTQGITFLGIKGVTIDCPDPPQ